MDLAEVEESFFAISDAKLHGGMCKTLLGIYCRTMNIFPALEAARPRSRSGIQALCSLHVALEKAKSILQHCCECSKLYLAITGDSILLKFERAKCSLVDSLKRVEDIVPSSIGCQVLEIVIELEGTVFAHDPFEKQVGEDIISLLQRGRRFDDDTTFDNKELECFHEAAGKLGINSSRAALAERRALKKLIERAQMEGDKRKESIVAYLLHLMRKYSKLFIRSDLAGGGDDNDSQGSSTPCSPTVQDGVKGGRQTAFDRQISKLNSFNFRPSLRFRSNDYRRYSGHIPIPPEELRCPISLQLMFDPVIVASGQTYEKVCIEKWFNDGHNTCPKTQQQLSHIWVTPNYCVKGLIASWCEQHGVPIPDGPPESLDLNYWRLALSDSESAKSRSETTTENDNSNCNISKGGGIKVVPLEESAAVAMIRGGNTINDNGVENGPTTTREMHVVREEEDEEEEGRSDVIYEKYVDVLYGDESLERKCIVVEKIRKFLKDDEEARNFMGDLGCVQALVRFLRFAVHERSQLGQEVGAMALFNIAVSNNRNKELMVSAGVIPILEDMINNPDSHGLVAALYLNLSCLEQAKPILGSGSSTKAVPFLIKLLLSSRTDPQSKQDSLHSLYNLSSHTRNIPFLLESGIITAIHTLLREPREHGWTEKSIAVLNNLGMTDAGKEAIVSSQGLMGELASILDVGEVLEQEQAVACLLTLCSDNDQRCIEMALDEGVIPALVSISVNGTTRGRDKSQKLLMVFRERRQQEYCSSTTSPPRQSVVQEMAAAVVIESSEKEMKTSNSTVVPTTARQQEQHKGNGTTRSLVKSISSRKLGRSFSFFSKCRNQSTRR